MQMNRRTFIAASTLAAGAALQRGARAQDAAKRYRACIIGDSTAGGYGHSMHLAFDLQPNVEVVGLADPDEAGRAKHAAECKAQRSYADYREMLATEKPDLVAIGPRWTTRHKEYVLACVEAGAHGFLEKPIAVDLEEADAMAAAVAAKNLKWNLAFNMRVSPVIDHLKKCLLEDEIIGSLLEVRARGKEDGRAGAEDMIVLGTHLFDLMLHLMGDAQWCMADITHNGKPATPADVREATEPLGPIVGNRLHAMYGFDKGLAGHFSSMKTKQGGQGSWGLEIYGNQGIVALHMDVVPKLLWLKDGSWRSGWNNAAWQPLPGAPEVTITDESRERHRYLIADLLNAIENDRTPAASLAHGVKAHEMVQACFAAHVQGGKVALPLENRSHPLKNWS
jgi:predicted dehydrogenase